MSEIKLNYHKTHFLTSSPNLKSLPEDSGVEIAFAGRSNAGKSTALNALTNQKNLARTSKTPGRTQLINLFEVEPQCKLVDLPGYGYADVPEQMKLQWQQALGEYLQKRECLAGIVILMDIRHPLKDLDQQMIEWAVASEKPVLLLLKSHFCDLDRKKVRCEFLSFRTFFILALCLFLLSSALRSPICL